MNDAELFGYHVKRAIHMFTVAALKGADILVIGAFGCGAFQNNPEVKVKITRYIRKYHKLNENKNTTYSINVRQGL